MPGSLNRAELRSWVALIGGIRSLLRSLDRQLRDDHGVSHDDYQILAHLSRVGPDGVRMSDLAGGIAYSPSRLTHAIGRLETLGWVVRRPSEADRRVVEVALTRHGSERVARISEGHLAHVRALVFDELGADRARELGDLMREVGRAAETADTQRAESAS